jgi:hypothetical protein
VHISRKLLVRCQLFLMSKDSFLVKSELLLPSVAKVYWSVFNLDTKSTWRLDRANALFSIQTVLVLAH